jgi:serine/threonine protein kinase
MVSPLFLQYLLQRDAKVRYYIAMEYISGKDVRSILKKSKEAGKRPSLPPFAYVIAEAAKGLEYAHQLKDPFGNPLQVIHRDISPQNILISYEGEVTLVDFGIAKAASKSTETRAGVLKGKMLYMSPEQAWGRPVDHRSDLYSLGVVLYEMIADRKIFDADSEFSMLEKVRNAQVEYPPETFDKVPKLLLDILKKTLQKNVEDRYQNAQEMLLDLENYLLSTRQILNEKIISEYLKDLFQQEIEEERKVLTQKIEEPAEITAPDQPRSKTLVAPEGSTGTDEAPEGTGEEERRNPLLVLWEALQKGGPRLKIGLLAILCILGGLIAIFLLDQKPYKPDSPLPEPAPPSSAPSSLPSPGPKIPPITISLDQKETPKQEAPPPEEKPSPAPPKPSPPEKQPPPEKPKVVRQEDKKPAPPDQKETPKKEAPPPEEKPSPVPPKPSPPQKQPPPEKPKTVRQEDKKPAPPDQKETPKKEAPPPEEKPSPAPPKPSPPEKQPPPEKPKVALQGTPASLPDRDTDPQKLKKPEPPSVSSLISQGPKLLRDNDYQRLLEQIYKLPDKDRGNINIKILEGFAHLKKWAFQKDRNSKSSWTNLQNTIERSGDRSATPLLLGVAKDPDDWTRFYAVSFLGRLGDNRALADLGTISNSDSNRRIRKEAQKAIKQIQGKGS